MFNWVEPEEPIVITASVDGNVPVYTAETVYPFPPKVQKVEVRKNIYRFSNFIETNCGSYYSFKTTRNNERNRRRRRQNG